ncbi:MAG: hypothetical protein IPO92_00935 [Saprospiraceae bacterium]|nr:hypothetical protein [Saprospiraceae bacterium]
MEFIAKDSSRAVSDLSFTPRCMDAIIVALIKWTGENGIPTYTTCKSENWRSMACVI